jgi:hypothetical protein
MANIRTKKGYVRYSTTCEGCDWNRSDRCYERLWNNLNDAPDGVELISDSGARRCWTDVQQTIANLPVLTKKLSGLE